MIETSYKILVTDVVHNSGLDYLKEHGYELKFTTSTDEDILIREIEDCDGVIVRGTKFTERIMASSSKLKVVCKHGVGAENIDINAARRLGLRVLNTPEANYISVAEQTMLLVLGCAKRFRIMQSASIKRDYTIRARIFTDEICNKTLGLIGFGRVGSALASIAINGFGMKVMAYDPFLPAERAPECIQLTDNREKVFRESDFISLHLPYTSETEKSVGAKEFAWMKPTAFLINAARGPIVDEAALIEALKHNIIAGAGLDVVESEPPQEGNPLLEMDNVVLTPHNAASTMDAMARMSLHVALGLDDFFSDRTPQWIVV